MSVVHIMSGIRILIDQDYSDLPGGYWTELRIGTPPQTFKLLLDFSWSSKYDADG
jgi:hypothetical protein